MIFVVLCGVIRAYDNCPSIRYTFVGDITHAVCASTCMFNLVAAKSRVITSDPSISVLGGG